MRSNLSLPCHTLLVLPQLFFSTSTRPLTKPNPPFLSPQILNFCIPSDITPPENSTILSHLPSPFPEDPYSPLFIRSPKFPTCRKRSHSPQFNPIQPDSSRPTQMLCLPRPPPNPRPQNLFSHPVFLPKIPDFPEIPGLLSWLRAMSSRTSSLLSSSKGDCLQYSLPPSTTDSVPAHPLFYERYIIMLLL